VEETRSKVMEFLASVDLAKSEATIEMAKTHFH